MAWRKRNSSNSTWLAEEAVGLSNIFIGDHSYGLVHINTSLPDSKLKIDSFCSIAGGVTFVTGNEHPLNRLSTFPFRVKVLGKEGPEAACKGGIVLDDDIWVGFGATILDGVHIGRGVSLLGLLSRRMCSLTQSSAVCRQSQSKSVSSKMSSSAYSSSTIQNWTSISWRHISRSFTFRWTSLFSVGC